MLTSAVRVLWHQMVNHSTFLSNITLYRMINIFAYLAILKVLQRIPQYYHGICPKNMVIFVNAITMVTYMPPKNMVIFVSAITILTVFCDN